MDQQRAKKDHDQDQDDDELMIPLSVSARLAPFVDRYFVKYYKIYEQKLTQYAFQHTNRLFMIGITLDHPIVKSQSPVVSVSFAPIGVTDSKTFVKGKKKKGAIKINTNQTIAIATLENGQTFELKGVVDGFIIEVNENIINDPTYIQNYPECKGFIAFINPFGNERKQKANLLEQDDYNRQIKENH